MKYNFYESVNKLTNFYLDTMYNPIIIGKENIPDSNFIVVSNHINWKDPMIIMYALGQEISFMAKKEAFEPKLFKWFLENMNAFPIDRENFDLKAVKHAVQLLKNGDNLGVFPEGTRNNEIGDFKPGIAGMGTLSKKLVLPTAITGTYKYKSDLILNIGEPINFKELDLKKEEKDIYLREEVKSLIIK